MNGVVGDARARSKEKDRYPTAESRPETSEPLWMSLRSHGAGYGTYNLGPCLSVNAPNGAAMMYTPRIPLLVSFMLVTPRTVKLTLRRSSGTAPRPARASGTRQARYD